MGVKQLHAGLIIDPIIHAIQHSKEKWGKQLRGMLNRLSYFDLLEEPGTYDSQNSEAIPSVAAVFSNFLSRGLPTRTSPCLNEIFHSVFDEVSYHEDRLGGFGYQIEQENTELIKRLVNVFCLIEPRSTLFTPIEIRTWENHLGSEFEERFLYELVPQLFGEFAIQLFETQKNINDLIDFTLDYHQDLDEMLNRPIDDFARQRIDFSIEFPFNIKGKRGIVIEIDGSQHEEPNQQHLDRLRDNALRRVGWEVFRLKTNQFHQASQILDPVKQYLNHRYFNRLKQKFDSNFLEYDKDRNDLVLLGSSILASRIQKSLLYLILNGSLNLSQSSWTMGIYERDVPGAYIAVEDFKATFNHLIRLSGSSISLPQIELTIFTTGAFQGNAFEQHFGYEVKGQGQVNAFEGDVFIDASLLQRTGLSKCSSEIKATKRITVRSSHSINSYKDINSAQLIKYPSILHQGNEVNRKESLQYFLHYFFRKKDFRDGQIEIIDRALQGKSVIGLLPTGGGKSLTYQICSLLQPGTAIVVDPIKSLMKDQFDGLLKNYIDAGVFINSSIKTQLKRDIAERKLMNGEVLFAFVSPERMQINKFRTQLHEMHHNKGKYFNYCVIDEAHCVSEWGHDFRTSYLRLGENVRNHCLCLGVDTIPLFGLTATASFDVLSDVKRELDLEEDDVVRRESARRKELFFNVVQSKTTLEGEEKDFEISQAIGIGKQKKLIEELNTLPVEIIERATDDLYPYDFEPESFYESAEYEKFKHAVLIFSPYKSSKVTIGVKSVAASLSVEMNHLKIGTYYGSDGMDDRDNKSEQYQDEFVKNKTNVLVATKAFGMGIDKPNIRSTVHINFPSSIESFVQESGRAGRDGKAALCTVILSDHEGTDRAIPEGFHATNFKGKEKEKSILMELLREITFPIQHQTNRLTDHVFQETGHYVKVNLWPKDSPTRIYINTGFQKGFGYIDVNNLSISTHGAFYSTEDSNKVLSAALNFISDENIERLNPADFLAQVITHDPLPGIEVLLDRINIGEEIDSVMLGFRNDRITKITELLQSEVDWNFTERMVSEAAQYARDLNSFIRSLKGKFKKHTGAWPSGYLEDVEGSLALLFYEIRNEQDTYKAVYRLSIVGIIDDYVVDYNSKTLNLKISKKRNEDYVDSFTNYLKRYLSNRRVEEKIASLENYEGSIIQRCLKCLIDFVYEEIGNKRFSAISSMEEACQTGLLNDGNSMKKFIELYFNSKFLDDLNAYTNNGKDFSPDIVWYFINEVGGSIDSWNHLRGSTTRLLNDQPNNGALLLLRSFSVILLESNEVFIERAQEDLIKGIVAFEESGFDKEEIIQKFKKEIRNQNPSKVSIVEDALQILDIKKHTLWLQNFNKKFIDYEYQSTSR